MLATTLADSLRVALHNRCVACVAILVAERGIANLAFAGLDRRVMRERVRRRPLESLSWVIRLRRICQFRFQSKFPITKKRCECYRHGVNNAFQYEHGLTVPLCRHRKDHRADW